MKWDSTEESATLSTFALYFLQEDRESISLPLLALLYRLDELDLLWKPCVTPV